MNLAPSLMLHSHTTRHREACVSSIFFFSICVSVLHPFGHFPLSPHFLSARHLLFTLHQIVSRVTDTGTRS
ncbi:Beta-glucosidase 1B [Fusarium oxysporum f. sp. albedinis]|nr:Beta-glucosidase 1B [Fusarium oxysporum f. sp. albedinis]